jgi:hypothetical protein
VADPIFNLQTNIELVARRCYDCGRWWAVERGWADTSACPMCCGKSLSHRLQTIAALERSIRSLRGAATRSRRRRG